LVGISRAIETDCAGLAVISGQNAELGALRHGERITDLGYRFYQLRPADLIIENAV
jgi:hypothetical protein